MRDEDHALPPAAEAVGDHLVTIEDLSEIVGETVDELVQWERTGVLPCRRRVPGTATRGWLASTITEWLRGPAGERPRSLNPPHATAPRRGAGAP
jgi:hypothetical protein